MNEIEIANHQLIAAFRRDTELYKKLEKSGKLFRGYDPDMRKCHEENARLLEDYMKSYGWPLPSKCGRKVHEAAWFIAIHAVSLPHVLRETVKILKYALDKGEDVATEYAKLFDRIALYEGREQVYGTQFFPSPNGFYARDLIDPENVDKRRASLGLSSFAIGKKDSGADEGGFIEACECEEYEKDFTKFLFDVGWRTRGKKT